MIAARAVAALRVAMLLGGCLAYSAGAAAVSEARPTPARHRRRSRRRHRATDRAPTRRRMRKRSACRSIRARSSSRRTTRAVGSGSTCLASAAVCRDAVTYYRTALKQRGTELFESPPTHQFEIGRFREETMAFPPSVTIKDYHVGWVGRLSEPQAGSAADALRDDHPDRPRDREK